MSDDQVLATPLPSVIRDYMPEKPEFECEHILELLHGIFPEEPVEDYDDETPEVSIKSFHEVEEVPVGKVVAFGSIFDPRKKFQHQPKITRNDIVIPGSIIDSEFCDTTYKTISGELAKSNKRGALGYKAERFKPTKPAYDVHFEEKKRKPPKPCFVPFNSKPERPPKVVNDLKPILHPKYPSCRRLPRLHCFGGYAPILPGVDIVSGTEEPPKCSICEQEIIKQDYYHRYLRDFVCLECVRENKHLLLKKDKLPEFNFLRPARDFEYLFDDPWKRDITTLKRKIAMTAYMAWYTPTPYFDN